MNFAFLWCAWLNRNKRGRCTFLAEWSYDGKTHDLQCSLENDGHEAHCFYPVMERSTGNIHSIEIGLKTPRPEITARIHG